ncbi:MAG: bifunctional diaminohydroxyphosphoribosylaminopyrimidine deaminase/5-amino-6-(5-phosphoribosylamino)uracil reductase RibD [Spirochaetia bacterium]|nr:bifunctional diaminohydroxyphosphoribosylaminopyrimidine deaminase/5-amino-6-(5-phosphoribosylamino)uracil reductase RibD [Spirochaetota bacterium]MCX8096658.1 bifunctional diaminohydroxyphosphoribosylaminopyrimidine deaminase/5-amino-6-(5-phosphoribosylamino)uracil reductase RibD [Spirochaetota bacterium]MDW8112489.1 bifunctional diaminohydroxyphosphoribosylaminopyrimidine deaminase/5-amino-6-(5-phosphoribosylamino)uracil reductase RibD [Spirochaetia bacterium]
MTQSDTIKVEYFELAYSLANKAKGISSPNPAVGAVIVKNGRLVSMGYTQPNQGKHAEIVAIENAKVPLDGATMIVTLEPHQYQEINPPCTEKIIESGIKRVYVGTIDKNPKVNGKGIARLKSAGVEVKVGFFEEDLLELNEDFFKFVTTGKPFVTVKYAISIDGKLGTITGDSKWISSEASREFEHTEIRRKADAIIVGVNTVILDNPYLTVRYRKKEYLYKQPLRCVIDPFGKTPIDSILASDELPTLFFVSEKVNRDFLNYISKRENKQYEYISLVGDRYLDVREIIDKLGERKVINVLVEGGGEIIGSFFDNNLVDKVFVFISPKFIGGSNAKVIGGRGVAKVEDSIRLYDITVMRIEDDVVMKGYVEKPY